MANEENLVTDAGGLIEEPSPCWLPVVFAGAIVFVGGGGFVEGPPPCGPSVAFLARGFRTTESEKES